MRNLFLEDMPVSLNFSYPPFYFVKRMRTKRPFSFSEDGRFAFVCIFYVVSRERASARPAGRRQMSATKISTAVVARLTG